MTRQTISGEVKQVAPAAPDSLPSAGGRILSTSVISGLCFPSVRVIAEKVRSPRKTPCGISFKKADGFVSLKMKVAS